MRLNGRAALAAAAVWIFCALGATTSAAADAGDVPIVDPWLNQHMPEGALAYVRFPNLLGLLTAPKGSSLDAALASKANQENARKLKDAISKNVFSEIPEFSDLRFRTLEEHLRSPVELALFMSPAPSALVAMNLDLSSDEAFYEVIEVFSLVDPSITMTRPMDDREVGEMIAGGMPVAFSFDDASGRLLLQVGPAAGADALATLLQSTTAASNQHAMHSMENSIDASGQGLFAWVDVENLLPAAQLFMPPEQLAELNAAGFDEVRTAALGWGVADGKGRLSFLLDIMEGGDRELLPYVSNDLSARSAGDPDALIVVSIPTAEEFARIEERALSKADDEARRNWIEGKAGFEEIASVSVDELLTAIGPEMLVIFDKAGDYMALRLRDSKLWDDILARVSEKSGTTVERKKISGTTVYHWALPSDFGLLTEEEAAEIGWAATMMRKQRDHYYWTTDGDFLYLASVPQILIDRQAYGAKTDVGKWMSETQRVDGSEALLSVVATTRKLPKRYYAAYIEILQFLGDISQANLDIWSMPTAKQLGLPDEGTIGFSLRLGKPTIGLELTFENNPFESLASGGIGSIAAVGVLAAIAVPAYQDYTIRAQVSEGLNLAAAQKAQVTELYLETGRLPNSEEADAMSVLEYAGEYTWSVIVEPETGVIVVTYNDDVGPEGGQMFLEPYPLEDGTLDWGCSSTLEDKHVPAACRGGELPFATDDT